MKQEFVSKESIRSTLTTLIKMRVEELGYKDVSEVGSVTDPTLLFLIDKYHIINNKIEAEQAIKSEI